MNNLYIDREAKIEREKERERKKERERERSGEKERSELEKESIIPSSYYKQIFFIAYLSANKSRSHWYCEERIAKQSIRKRIPTKELITIY